MSKLVLFDLDDTLLDFKHNAMNSINDEFGKDIHWNGWDTYNLLDIYGLTEKELVHAWTKHEVLENAYPLVHAHTVLNLCHFLDYDIHLVSARAWHPDGEAITRECLEQYEMPYDELIITMPGTSKVDSLGDNVYEFAVDDHFDNCLDFSDSDQIKKTYMMHAPWNKSHNLHNHNIERIYCLNDLRKILEKGI